LVVLSNARIEVEEEAKVKANSFFFKKKKKIVAFGFFLFAQQNIERQTHFIPDFLYKTKTQELNRVFVKSEF
jgi:hypothetical protein